MLRNIGVRKMLDPDLHQLPNPYFFIRILGQIPKKKGVWRSGIPASYLQMDLKRVGGRQEVMKPGSFLPEHFASGRSASCKRKLTSEIFNQLYLFKLSDKIYSIYSKFTQYTEYIWRKKQSLSLLQKL